jgi:hypothetical protein
LRCSILTKLPRSGVRWCLHAPREPDGIFQEFLPVSRDCASIEEYPNKTNDDADCLVRELTKTLSNYCIRLRIAVSPEYETIAMTPAVLVQRARRKKAA